jgi:hypothetical protein
MTDTTITPNVTPAAPAKTNWKEQKEKLIAKFSTLTADDLRYDEGKKDEMLERVQIKIGKTKDELASIIAAL